MDCWQSLYGPLHRFINNDVIRLCFVFVLLTTSLTLQATGQCSDKTLEHIKEHLSDIASYEEEADEAYADAKKQIAASDFSDENKAIFINILEKTISRHEYLDALSSAIDDYVASFIPLSPEVIKTSKHGLSIKTLYETMPEYKKWAMKRDKDFQQLSDWLQRDGKTVRDLCFRDDGYSRRREYLRELVKNAIAKLEDRIEEIVELTDKGNGGLVIFYIDGWFDSFEVDGGGTIGAAYRFYGEDSSFVFRVVRLPTGHYNYGRMITSKYNNGYHYIDFDNDEYGFTVEEDKLHYIGHLHLSSGHAQRTRKIFGPVVYGHSGLVMDSASKILDALDRNYQDLYDIFPLVNGLSPNDHFLPFLLAERRRHASLTDNESNQAIDVNKELSSKDEEGASHD